MADGKNGSVKATGKTFGTATYIGSRKRSFGTSHPISRRDKSPTPFGVVLSKHKGVFKTRTVGFRARSLIYRYPFDPLVAWVRRPVGFAYRCFYR